MRYLKHLENRKNWHDMLEISTAKFLPNSRFEIIRNGQITFFALTFYLNVV